jgi:diphthine-ammonia ligase
MEIFGLFSGGKDSVYSLVEAVRLGHRVVALLNVHPASPSSAELDSWMFQTAGWSQIPALAAAAKLPLVRATTLGESSCRSLEYTPSVNDEVEDLVSLLRKASAAFPSARGVACGALASGYQRARVEDAAARVGLLPIALLWGRAPRGLLRDLSASGVESRLVRVAAGACLPAARFLGASVASRATRKSLRAMNDRFGVHVAGEGGEYETMTFNAPLYFHRLEARPLTQQEKSSTGNASWHIESLSSIEKESEQLRYDAAALRPDWRRCLRALRRGELLPSPPAFPPPPPPAAAPSTPVSGVHHVNESMASHVSEARAPFADLYTVENGCAPAAASANACSPQVSVHGDQLYFAGIDGRLEDESDRDVGAATSRAISRLRDALHLHGACLLDVIFVRLWLADMSDFGVVNKAYSAAWDEAGAGGARSVVPARVCLQAVGGPAPVIIDCVAIRGSARAASRGFGDSRRALAIGCLSRWAPLCIGPYCQAVTIEDAFVFAAGQIGLVPESMALEKGGLWTELKRVLLNASRVLSATGDSALTLLIGARLYIDARALSAEAAENGGGVAETLAKIQREISPWLDGHFGRGADPDDDQFSGESTDDGNDSDSSSLASGESDASSYACEREFSLGTTAHVTPSYLKVHPHALPLPYAAMLPVHGLPRGAAVEIEFIALTAEAAQLCGGLRGDSTAESLSHSWPRVAASAWAWEDRQSVDVSEIESSMLKEKAANMVRRLHAVLTENSLSWSSAGIVVSVFFFSTKVGVRERVAEAFAHALASAGGSCAALSITPLAAPSGSGALVAHVWALAQARARCLLWHARATKQIAN